MEEQEKEERVAPVKDAESEERVSMLPTTEAQIMLELEDFIARSSTVKGKEGHKLSIVTGSAASQATAKMLGLSRGAFGRNTGVGKKKENIRKSRRRRRQAEIGAARRNELTDEDVRKMFPAKSTVRERQAKMLGREDMRYQALIDEHEANEREIQELLLRKAELQKSVREAKEAERQSFLDPIKRIREARAIRSRKVTTPGRSANRPATVAGITKQGRIFSASLGPTRPLQSRGDSLRRSPRKRPGTAPEPSRTAIQDTTHILDKKQTKETGPGLVIPWRYLSLAPPAEAGKEEKGKGEAKEEEKGKEKEESLLTQERCQEEQMLKAEDLAALFPDVYVAPRSNRIKELAEERLSAEQIHRQLELMKRKIKEETLRYKEEEGYYQKERNALLQKLRESEKERREEAIYARLHAIEKQRSTQYDAGNPDQNIYSELLWRQLPFLTERERSLHLLERTRKGGTSDIESLIEAAMEPSVISEVENLGGDVLERWCDGLSADLERQDALEASLRKVMEAFSKIKLPPCTLRETLHSATRASCKVLDAAQAQIWLVDEVYGFDIIAQVPDSSGHYREKRVPMIPCSQPASDTTKLGFAAYVAKTGNAIRVPLSNLTKSPHYNARTDWWMYNTSNSLMCLPLFSFASEHAGNAENTVQEKKDFTSLNARENMHAELHQKEARKVLGVIVYVGKGKEVSAGGMTVKDTAASFSEEDEFLATVWSHFLARVLAVSREVDSMIRQQERKDAMFNYVKEIFPRLDMLDLIQTIQKCAKQMLSAAQCNIFLLNSDKSKIWPLYSENAVRRRERKAYPTRDPRGSLFVSKIGIDVTVGDRVEIAVNDRSYPATIKRVDTVSKKIGISYDDGYSEKNINLKRIIKFNGHAADSIEGKASVDPSKDPASVMGKRSNAEVLIADVLEREKRHREEEMFSNLSSRKRSALEMGVTSFDSLLGIACSVVEKEEFYNSTVSSPLGHSIVCIPIRRIRNGEILGAIQIVDCRVKAGMKFDGKDTTFLDSIAYFASLAIEQSRVYNFAEEACFRFGRMVTTEDLSQVVLSIQEGVAAFMGVEKAHLLVYDNDKSIFYSFRKSAGTAGRARKNKNKDKVEGEGEQEEQLKEESQAKEKREVKKGESKGGQDDFEVSKRTAQHRKVLKVTHDEDGNKHSVAWHVFRSGQRKIYNDIKEAKHFNRLIDKPSAEIYDIRNIMACPLVLDGGDDPVGVLMLLNKTNVAAPDFVVEDEKRAEILTKQIVPLIRHKIGVRRELDLVDALEGAQKKISNIHGGLASNSAVRLTAKAITELASVDISMLLIPSASRKGMLETRVLGPDKKTWKKVFCRSSTGIVGKVFRSRKEVELMDEGTKNNLVKSDRDANDALGILTGHVVAFPIFAHQYDESISGKGENVLEFHKPNGYRALSSADKHGQQSVHALEIKAILIVQNINSKLSRNSLFLCRVSIPHISIALNNVELAESMQARVDAMAYLASNAAALTLLVLDKEGRLVDCTRSINGKGGPQDDCAYDTQGNRILFHLTDADLDECKTSTYEDWLGTKTLPCGLLKMDIKHVFETMASITKHKQKLGGMTRINSFSGHAVFRDASMSAKERKKMSFLKKNINGLGSPLWRFASSMTSLDLKALCHCFEEFDPGNVRGVVNRDEFDNILNRLGIRYDDRSMNHLLMHCQLEVQRNIKYKDFWKSVIPKAIFESKCDYAIVPIVEAGTHQLEKVVVGLIACPDASVAKTY